jgi:hypothetical protein
MPKFQFPISQISISVPLNNFPSPVPETLAPGSYTEPEKQRFTGQ